MSTRAMLVTDPGGTKWVACLACSFEAWASSGSTVRHIEEDGEFGTRECEECGTEVSPQDALPSQAAASQALGRFGPVTPTAR